MSVDLSDSALRQAIRDVADPASSVTWFLATYPPGSTSQTALRFLVSGADPVVPQWRQHLHALGEARPGEPAFGYGEIGGKGCVIFLLSDEVGGVRRARAVVHSRAVAALFPDYHALVTITHPAQLTDELIIEKLNLKTLPSSSSSSAQVSISSKPNPVTTEPETSMQQVADAERGNGLTKKEESNGEVAVPQGVERDDVDGERRPTEHLGGEGVASGRAGSGRLDETTTVEPEPSRVRFEEPSASPSSSNFARGVAQNSSSTYYQPYTPDNSSPTTHSSNTTTGKDPRTRKVSLTTRLGKAFGNPALQHQLQPQPQPQTSETVSSPVQASAGSPSSPSSSSSRFKNSLSRAFRRSSGGKDESPSSSPKVNEFGAHAHVQEQGDSDVPPPLPPKDNFPLLPDNGGGLYGNGGGSGGAGLDNGHAQTSASASAPGPGPGHFRTASGGLGYTPPPPAAASGFEGTSIPQENGQPTPAGSSGRDTAPTAYYDESTSYRPPPPGPGPAAAPRLEPSPSAQRALAEARAKSVEAEEEIQARFRRDLRMAPPPNSTGAGRSSTVTANTNDNGTASVSSAYPSNGEHGMANTDWVPGRRSRDDDEESIRLAYDDPEHDPHAGAGLAPLGPILPSGQGTGMGTSLTMDHNGKAASASGSLPLPATEDAQRDIDQETKAEVQKHIYEQERQEAILAEPQSEVEQGSSGIIQEDGEKERMLQEADERLRLAAMAKDEEEKRLEDERMQRERREVEEQEEEEERQRLIESERQRQENERLIEVERMEQENREKEEAEKRRRVMHQALAEGKASGGVMLRGWVTVQSTQSVIWRRRYFHLLSYEMQLFKAEKDTTPIQAIPLGSGSIHQIYEESQVQGSWKISTGTRTGGAGGGDEWFLFADSAEEKEMVLEGLRVAMG